MTLLSSKELAQAGREIPAPFTISLFFGSDIREAICEKVLRVVPGRRVVVKMRVGDQVYLGKIFLGAGRNKYLERESSGIEILQSVGVNTAVILDKVSMSDEGGGVLLLEYLPDVRHLSDWVSRSIPVNDEYLTAAIRMMAALHNKGFKHDDCHLDNFLISGNQLYLVDGDAVNKTAGDKKVEIANLALYLVQLPVKQSERLLEFFEQYCGHRGWVREDCLVRFRQEIYNQRANRQRRYLGKIFRNCTQFNVSKHFSRFVALNREAATDGLQALVKNPDKYIESGEMLKDGNSATVALVELDGVFYVVKRYNIKNLGHWLSRCWRPSRAWVSWRNAQLLKFYGIETPLPLALIEERCGPLRGKAYFISEYLFAEDVLSYVKKITAQPSLLSELAQQFASLFRVMKLLRLSHGDFKATNFLLKDGVLSVIDLDSMLLHTKEQGLQKALDKDKRRFINNWKFDPLVERVMHEALYKD